MFVDAYKLAAEFTKPVIVSIRRLDGSVQCSCGAFVVLNENGWIITVAHLWNWHHQHQQDLPAVQKYRADASAIEKDAGLSAKQKQRQLRRLKGDPKWVTNSSFWWGRDEPQIAEARPLPEADLVAVRLEPWSPSWASSYPTIKDPTKPMDVGRSLCKLGYPFHDISATYDETKDAFQLAEGTLPLPRFPIEGIYTRDAVTGKSADGKYDLKLLETSSPGLRGQSGGPIFDTRGTVWAIQSQTIHLPLGFSPKLETRGRTIEEHQFLNAGLGVHAEVIVPFLRDNGIDFQLSDY